MTPETFRTTHLRRRLQSPHRGACSIRLGGDAPVALTDVPLHAGSNEAEAQEFGEQLMHTLRVDIPKDRISRRPAVGADSITHAGRDYKVRRVRGDDAYSPFWVVNATAPMS